ncbi:DeoR/GlpR family DNA-binding transcription regulator [Enterovibrio norvegicus]|uniref:Glycerol-3-phosphate regulon repressor n=1 Tax=Enterovibrio norvegicus TaxID=188144 RepID=A0A2N7L9T5_9GAMM|nr:DeoR/GlpR family DNA-binding transcription regulator [Enterovibrio norvegicus]PML78859.1 glycerol-3-phosphate regulon repressor [Enterovibrio norvegicus]PMN70821.1 glycerol-3-phosphate regulon repressor [Enterovibrio norvegicus]PMN91084.1 glycerol-3-phosphate regulon repressor [Enterovibrio norvegicus]
MEVTDRQRQILDYIHRNGNVQVEELAEMFSITTQTVRRDVNALSEKGLARRVHGGVSLPAVLTNTTYQFRYDLESGVKKALAHRVASEIPDGATVFIGIGTSATYVAQYLSGMKQLRVVTNNLQVLRILENAPGVEVLITGGLVRSDHQDVVGSSVLQFFDAFEADIGIVGCGSISSTQVAMEHEIQEADVSKAIIANARECWLMADASKWERFASVKVASLSCFSRIFTNKAGLSAELPVSMVESDA